MSLPHPYPRFELGAALTAEQQAFFEEHGFLHFKRFIDAATVAELVAIFTVHEVPHAPILKLLEALDTPQARHREMVVEVEHAALSGHRQQRQFVRRLG